MSDGLVGVTGGVDHIGSNVFDHMGPSVGIGWREDAGNFEKWMGHHIVSLNFSASDFSKEPEGMDVSVRGGKGIGLVGPLGILGRARIDYVRDMGNGENYHGLLFGGEGGFALDFKYVDLNITGGLGFGWMDRNDIGRFDTHYTASALLDINFWPVDLY